MQATLFTLFTQTINVSQFFNILKPNNSPNTKKAREKNRKNTIAKQKGNHTEQQKGTRQQNSISQITVRALNVNGLGDQKKREKTLKKTKPKRR